MARPVRSRHVGQGGVAGVGIGSNFFAEFTDALNGQEPDIGQAMSLVLASLSLFGLGIFGPSIASGLVSGAPQLGAGAAVGTAVGAGGIAMLAGGAAVGGARLVGGAALSAVRSGTAMGSAASTAYHMGQEAAVKSTVGAGLGRLAQAAGNAARSRARSALGLSEAAASGRQAAWNAMHGQTPSASAPTAQASAPAWARSLRAEQASRHHRQVAIHTISQGDHGGSGAMPDIEERND